MNLPDCYKAQCKYHDAGPHEVGTYDFCAYILRKYEMRGCPAVFEKCDKYEPRDEKYVPDIRCFGGGAIK